MARRIFLALSIFLFSSSVHSMEILSYDDAMKVAGEKNKPVYVLFTGDYCSWCMKQKDVLESKVVEDSLRDYVVCYVNSKDEVAKKHRIKAIPVSMVLDSEGRVLRKNVGFMDEKDFLAWLN